MKGKLNSLLPKGEFSKNVLTLVTGTAVAQALPVAISPVLTRLYTPEEFGVFSVFFAIVAIFGVIANGRYELAVMLPEEEEEAINVFVLGFVINIFLSLLLLIIVLFFQDFLVENIGVPEIRGWLYFVPFTIFFIGCFNMLSYFNTRQKNYKDIAKATAVKSFVMAVIQLLLGFFKFGVGGLINGHIFSQLFANLRLAKNITSNKKLIDKINTSEVKKMAVRYKRFPKYSMWGIFANTISQHYISILISTFYSVATLGFYSLSLRVLGAPIVLLGKSVGQVFFQTATEEKNKTGFAKNTFVSTVKKLLLIGVPFFLCMYFLVEKAFLIVFGEKWAVAGEYTKILVPLFFIRFVVTTLSNINNIFEQQKLALIWQLTLLVLTLSVIYYSNMYALGFKEFLNLFVIVISLHYLLLFFILRRVSYKGKLF